MKKIYAWEPWFFIFFGLFHMHRIWGLIDRQGYADFWLGILAEKGVLYFALMGLLAVLCVCGMVVFFRHLKTTTGGAGFTSLVAVTCCLTCLPLPSI